MLDSKPTLQTLLDHRSIRKYTGEPISDEMLTAVLEAGRAVSTSSFFAGNEHHPSCRSCQAYRTASDFL
ncbi:nitroreductase family protein [Moraxella porci]|nr:nitroreductase family protein [Moraxella porci]MDH2274358.1 nitroreductase family protein [Moraxella porci]